jgi:predicted neuraminidase
MFIFEKAPFPSCHASTLVEAEPGRLLAAWFAGKDEGARDVKIWQAAFDGKAWSRPEVVAEEPGFPCWNPVLFRSPAAPAAAPAGTLMLFYKAGPSPMTWSAYLRRSADGGRTWGKVEAFPAGLLGPIKNKPIALRGDGRRGGTILAGTSVESHRAWTGWVERSRDDGRTWQRFGPIQVPDHPHGVIQPTLFERRDGSVLALCRSRGLGAVVASESRDGGETWSPGRATELPNPNSGIDGVRTDSGDFYLVYNHTKSGRTPLNLARSTDEGKTWTRVRTLEDQPGEFSYPAIIEDRAGRLQIAYTWNRTHIKQVAVDPADLK